MSSAPCAVLGAATCSLPPVSRRNALFNVQAGRGWPNPPAPRSPSHNYNKPVTHFITSIFIGDLNIRGPPVPLMFPQVLLKPEHFHALQTSQTTQQKYQSENLYAWPPFQLEHFFIPAHAVAAINQASTAYSKVQTAKSVSGMSPTTNRINITGEPDKHNDRFRDLLNRALPNWRLLKQALDAESLSHNAWADTESKNNSTR